jgi:predicted secreted acid phosphatase
MRKRFPLILVLGFSLALALPAAPAQTMREPANLYALKQEINAYVSSGAYGKEVARVAVNANKYLVKRIAKGVAKGKKMAVVFDIDETTLSNLRHIQANDFGYVAKTWDAWIAEAQGTAIFPVQTIYDTAVRAKVDVFFITGRKPSDAATTEQNLRAVGYETWTKMFYKPAEFAQGTRAFKIDIRRQLTVEGYVIIANIGDQDSDLLGGYAEKTFKLPNPFYITN